MKTFINIDDLTKAMPLGVNEILVMPNPSNTPTQTVKKHHKVLGKDNKSKLIILEMPTKPLLVVK